jgi:hypothetical protein
MSKRPTQRPSLRPTSVPPFDIETFAKAKMEAGSSRGKAAIEELSKRVRAGDLRGGLRVVESLVALEPDSPEVLADAERCRAHLASLCESRLGSLSQVPARVEDAAPSSNPDPNVRVVLGLVDGVSSFEMIVEASKLPRVQALLLLDELRRAGMIEVV